MDETKQFLLGSVVTPLAVSIMSLISMITVGVVQINDNDTSCSQTRSDVIEQVEKNPKVLSLPYPEDSEEEQECKINDFIRQLKSRPGPASIGPAPSKGHSGG